MKKTRWALLQGTLAVAVSLALMLWGGCGDNQVGSDELESDDVDWEINQNDWIEINECSDGVDNNNDGTADYYGVPAYCASDGNLQDCVLPPDPHCSVTAGGKYAMGESECRDRLDNDGDGYIDQTDWGCSPCGVYVSSIASESFYKTHGIPECCDLVDNDGDGKIDYKDEDSCANSYDMLEEGKCFNGVDDDNDGLVDLADPGCVDEHDNDETDPTP